MPHSNKWRFIDHEQIVNDVDRLTKSDQQPTNQGKRPDTKNLSKVTMENDRKTEIARRLAAVTAEDTLEKRIEDRIVELEKERVD